MVSHLDLITYLVIVVSAAHILTVIKYNYKRRFYEKALLFIQAGLVFGEAFLYSYLFITREYGFKIVFEYMYNEAPFIHVVSSILYGNPLLISLVIVVLGNLVVRALLSGYMGRVHFRRFVWGSSLYIIGVHLVFIVSNMYEVSGNTYAQGMGGYIYQVEPPILVLNILLLVASWAGLFSGLLVVSTWVRKIDRVLGWIKALTDLSLVLLVSSFLLRLFIIMVYEARRSFFELRSIDVLIIAGLAVVLFTKDSLNLGYRRVIGSLAFSSTLLLTFFTVLLVHLSPPVLMGSVNAVDVNLLVPALLIPFFIGFLLMGREVYKRPFYPWMSEDDDYFIRLSTSSIYFLVILAAFYMAITLSVYYSSGSNPYPSSDFVYSVFVMFFIGVLLPSLVSVIIIKWKNFYLIYSIIVLLLVVFVGLRTYHIFDAKPYVPTMTIVAVLSSMYWLFRRGYKRGVVLYSLLLSIVLAVVFIGGYSKGLYDTGNIIELKKMAMEGHEVKYLEHSLLNSSFMVATKEGNVTLPYYRGLELNIDVDGSIQVLRRLQQPNTEAILSPGILINDGFDTVKIFITTFTVDGSSITLAMAKYRWVNLFSLVLMGVLGIIGFILYGKEL